MLKKSQLFKLALLQCKIITSVKYWGGGGGGGGGEGRALSPLSMALVHSLVSLKRIEIQFRCSHFAIMEHGSISWQIAT